MNTTLSPQAGRDTDTPDAGWHYSPLDWWVCGVSINSNVVLLLTNSVAIGLDYKSNSWGFLLKSGTLLSVGSPTAYNRIVRAHNAQEKSGGNPGTRACFYDGSTVGNGACELRLRFTEFAQLADDGYMLYTGTKFRALEWTHDRFYSPWLVIDTAGSLSLNCGFTNSLWERASLQIGLGTIGSGVTVHLRNNVVRTRILEVMGNTNWTLRDNLFDRMIRLTNNNTEVENSYNGYYQTTWGLAGGQNNTNLSSLTYEIGPLGRYYQPSNSILINLGSQNATNAGLYHFTSVTNQVKETNSIVDIGIHYVAVDANANPTDADGDGYPDYSEDANGNGYIDSGESEPATPDTATVDNCHLASYWYGAANPRVPSEIMEGYSYFDCRASGNPENWSNWIRVYSFFNQPYPYASDVDIKLEANRTVDDQNTGYMSTFIYKETEEKGIADHIAAQEHFSNDLPTLFYYYDWGTYNPTNRTFTVGGTNDWRMTIFYGHPSRYELPFGNVLGDEMFSVEGHVVPSYIHFYAERNQSWKETTILRRGMPVLKEKYVYTGTNSSGPVFELLDQQLHYCDARGHVTNITRIDPVSLATRILYTADWKGTNQFDSDLKLSETDELGITFSQSHDSWKRLSSKTKVGIASSGGYPAQFALTTTYTYDAYNRKIRDVTAGGSLLVTNSWAYDPAGRMTAHTNEVGLVTSYSYASGGRVTTKTLPGGATVVTENFLDRRVKSVTGTGVVEEHHDYFVSRQHDPDGSYTIDQQYDMLYTGSSNSSRWSQKGIDGLGRPVSFIKPAHSGNGYSYVVSLFGTSYRYINYNTDTLLSTIVRSGIADTYIAYDLFGRTNWQGSRLSGPYAFGPSTLDRLTASDIFFVKEGSSWFQATTNSTYLMDNNGTPTVRSVVKERLTAFSANVKAETTITDFSSNTTSISITIDRAAKKVTTVTDTPESTLNATNVEINGLLQSESTPSLAAAKQYRYDGLSRPVQVINSRGFTSSATYNPATGQLTGITDFAGNPTSYEYYPSSHTNAGRLKSETNASGKKTYYAYNLRGQRTLVWGAVPYPEERLYNSYGELVQLKTYRGGTGWSQDSWPPVPGTADTTTWIFESQTGLLTNVTDAAGRSVSYGYDTAERLTKITRARLSGTNAVTVTNIYNVAGDLERIDYSDGTPSVIYAEYNRAGQPRKITDATGDHVLMYDHASRLVSDSCTNGDFAGITTSNHFNAVFGRDGIRIQGTSPELQQDYSYDAYRRLAGAGYGSYSIAYSTCQILTCYSPQRVRVIRQRFYSRRAHGISRTVYNPSLTS